MIDLVIIVAAPNRVLLISIAIITIVVIPTICIDHSVQFDFDAPDVP
jgi:hypothetical protein